MTWLGGGLRLYDYEAVLIERDVRNILHQGIAMNHAMKTVTLLASVATLALAAVGPSAQTSVVENALGTSNAISAVALVADASEHTFASTAFFDGINVSAIAIGAYE